MGNLGPTTGPAAAQQLNRLTDRLGDRFSVVAAPAGDPYNDKIYALYLWNLLGEQRHRPGAFLAYDMNVAHDIIRWQDLNEIWNAWERSCEQYAATQTDEAQLRAAVDHARRTWSNYVKNEVGYFQRKKMAEPTAANILVRLRQKGQCDSMTVESDIQAILDTL